MTSDKSSHVLTSLSGIPIRVHYSYYAFVAVILFICALVASTAKLVLIFQVLVGTFFAVLFHELGHAYIAHRLRHQVEDIMIYPIGGIATILIDKDRYSDVMKIALAGPAVNILIGSALCFVPLGWVFLLGLINLFLGIGNLLPVRSFDGGLVLHTIISNAKNKEAADDILYRLTILIVCGITSLGFYMSSTTICAVGLFVFIYSTLTHDDL